MKLTCPFCTSRSVDKAYKGFHSCEPRTQSVGAMPSGRKGFELPDLIKVGIEQLTPTFLRHFFFPFCRWYPFLGASLISTPKNEESTHPQTRSSFMEFLMRQENDEMRVKTRKKKGKREVMVGTTFQLATVPSKPILPEGSVNGSPVIKVLAPQPRRHGPPGSSGPWPLIPSADIQPFCAGRAGGYQ